MSHPEPPTIASEPAERFWRDYTQLLKYLLFTVQLAEQRDEARERARPVLAKYYAFIGDEERVEEVSRPDETSALGTLREFGDLALEMTLSRVVDNYLGFVADLLALIFRTRPEALRSGEQVRLDFVLTHNSMEELIEALTERRVERLTYAGFQALHDDLERDLGFRLFSSDTEFRQAIRYVEMRNLIVHNRAVVNRRFLNRVQDADIGLGERLDLSSAEVTKAMDLFAATVNRTDAEAAEKWDLSRDSVDVAA